MSMQPRQKRKVFLYTGIAFVMIGIVSMVLTFILLYWWYSSFTFETNCVRWHIL